MKRRTRSRTHAYALAVAALAPLEASLHLLQGQLGDWYPVVFLLLAAGISVLRELTTEPVG